MTSSPYASVFRDELFKKNVLFRKRNEIILHFLISLFYLFIFFFLIHSLEYLDIVLSKTKDMSETAFNTPFSNNVI